MWTVSFRISGWPRRVIAELGDRVDAMIARIALHEISMPLGVARLTGGVHEHSGVVKRGRIRGDPLLSAHVHQIRHLVYFDAAASSFKSVSGAGSVIEMMSIKCSNFDAIVARTLRSLGSATTTLHLDWLKPNKAPSAPSVE